MTDNLNPDHPLRSGGQRAVIFALLTIGFLAVLSIVFLSHSLSQEFRKISVAAELRERTGAVFVNLIDMNITERSYMTSRHAEDVKHIMAVSHEIDNSLNALQKIVDSHPEWQSWFDSIDDELKLARNNILYRVNIAITRPEEVTGRIIDMSGQQMPSTKHLHELMGIFSSGEQGDIFAQGLRFERTRLAIIISSFIILVSALALGYLLINRFRHELKQLVQQSDLLGKENEVLEQRVLEHTSELEAARHYAEKERARVELLLQDTSHRIGNSLAMVSSLLNLQSNRTDDEQVRAALTSARDRILTISSAHRRLRLNDDMETSEVSEFLKNVVNDVKMAVMGGRSQNVNIVTDFAECYVASRDVTTLGIILGELLTNAIKHAFSDGREGTVRIFFGYNENDGLELVVEDNGVGLPKGESNKKTGLGQLVVRQLCRQFGEEPRFEAAPITGTKVIVLLPELKLVDPGDI